MSVHLTQLERTATKILGDLRRLEEISVPSAAKMLRKPIKFVRQNFPIIIHSSKSHHIRVADILAYQERRTVRPLNGKEPA